MTALIGLFAVAVLLAAPAPSDAECAWVLWVEESWVVAYKRDERPTIWTLVEAHPKRVDCEQAQTEKITVLSKREGVQRRANIISWTITDYISKNTRVICVPDTLDPRGPKGG